MFLCGNYGLGFGLGCGEVSIFGLLCLFGLLVGEGIVFFDECIKDLLRNEWIDLKIFVFFWFGG